MIRNFLALFKRFKVATWLNIIGLSVAFATFLIILLQVHFEYNYDRFHSTAKRVYRVDKPTGASEIFDIIHPRPFVEEMIRFSPHTEAGTILSFSGQVYLTVEGAGEKQGFRENICGAHADIVKVFDFPIIQGDPACLNDPEKVIIPRSLAEKLFGEELAVGKTLMAHDEVWVNNRSGFTIGAVYEDFPANTQLKNVIYTAINPELQMDQWQSSNFLCYLLLDHPSSAAQIETEFNNSFDFSRIGAEDGYIRLTRMTDIYYLNENWDERVIKSGSRERTLVLMGVALLIIIIAAINFTNFSMALVPMRIKNINTRKVLGSTDGQLRMGMLIESVLLSVLAFLVGVGLVFLLNRTSLVDFIEVGISFPKHLGLTAVTFLIALIVGVVAGVYPSWYITSFPPALVLKGAFGLSPKGRSLRTFLIGFQYVVSIILIIVAIFIQIQRNYMQGFTVGFDKDQIALIELTEELSEKNRETLVNRLTTYAGIADVAFSMEKMGAQDTYATNSFTYNGERIRYHTFFVSSNFFKVMGIPFLEGKEPGPVYDKGGDYVYVLSEPMKERYGILPGSHNLHGGDNRQEVLGYVGNARFTSLRQDDFNNVYVLNSGYTMSNSYIRMLPGTDVFGAISHIRSVINELEPGYPVQVEFYDEVFNQVYLKEERLNKMISYFSVLAILISLAGVFGLVLFEAQYRRKEIGVRKVFGAEIRDILIMFNQMYLYIVCICFILAAPIAYYAIQRWLENFAYKTPVYLWVFAVAFLIVAGITALTVTFQNWHAASENPVDSVKSE